MVKLWLHVVWWAKVWASQVVLRRFNVPLQGLIFSRSSGPVFGSTTSTSKQGTQWAPNGIRISLARSSDGALIVGTGHWALFRSRPTNFRDYSVCVRVLRTTDYGEPVGAKVTQYLSPLLMVLGSGSTRRSTTASYEEPIQSRGLYRVSLVRGRDTT